ncbi:hypothetical protein CRG98_014127 [Punica granatum]|uniref:Uncharacterized protein n=1 Tax=Punica granatum TaxID=22663 RepID=A0A2I0KA99_PUNGR|nr:hypothetical protein CRG98_014127 [Punica granatum]
MQRIKLYLDLYKTKGRLKDSTLGSVDSMEKTINEYVSKQTGSSLNPLSVPSGVAKLCALEFHLVGAHMRAPMQRDLGMSTFSGTHVRRSRHYLFTTRRLGAGELPGSRGTRYT